MLKTIISGVLSVTVTFALAVTLLQEALSTPQVYFSTSATKLEGKPVCAKIETPEGEMPCKELPKLAIYATNWSR